MQVQLLPCPFCGSNDLMRSEDLINSTDRIMCRACKSNAVLWKWNTRAHQSRDAEVQRLRELEKAALAIGKLSLVQGDAAMRENPHSQIAINSTITWAVNEGDKSAHKQRQKIIDFNAALLTCALNKQEALTPTKEA